MNFDVLRVINSYPQFETSHDAEYRYLNYDFSYDAMLDLSILNLQVIIAI